MLNLTILINLIEIDCYNESRILILKGIIDEI